MAGLALIFKRIQSAFQILQFVFVAFLAVHVDRYPLTRYIPLTLGNSLIRDVMVDGVRLWELPLDQVVLSVIVGAFYLGLGIAAFGYYARIARDRDLLGQYWSLPEPLPGRLLPKRLDGVDLSLRRRL